MKEIWVGRAVVVMVTALLAGVVEAFGLPVLAAAGIGAALGLALVTIEARLRRASLRRVIGAGTGLVVGVAVAYLAAAVIGTALEPQYAAFLQAAALIAGAYWGIAVGAGHASALNLSALHVFAAEETHSLERKALDTSAIIDGRVVDIAETGFIDGELMIPRFVLWELQTIADSGDPMRRARGRRGLDAVQRLQQTSGVEVKILDKDYASIREVDRKLIEFAKEMGAKIVTNDFNLNKLARLQGVSVLNVNDLANALKPVVLPGESMQVLIQKEGKEYNQGVAYLDDGTMVVVDNARDQIGATIDVTVTSVLQTAAGKMIFGRYGEESPATAPPPAPGTQTIPGRPRPPRSSGAVKALTARGGEQTR